MPRELLFSVTRKDFDVQTFCSGGPGGQHQNKTESGVRIVHPESGAIGESRSERSQHQNKRIAFKRLANSQKFMVWIAKKKHELTIDKRKIERQVNEAMQEQKLKVEVKNNGKWTPWSMFEKSTISAPIRP